MNSVLMFQPITDDRNPPREGDLTFRHFDLMPTDPRMLLVEYGPHRGRHLYTKGRNSETNESFVYLVIIVPFPEIRPDVDYHTLMM